ncbi:MAG: UDP-2,3-diacylglucosamine diphosphatase [Bacteroidota bacterium]|nr:UDP-2,3-diacylglucosamine diphosphatase [Bacteroidota bacterium]
MKNIFFFSDVHLGLQDKQHEKEKEKRVLSFLSHVEEHGEQLFIVGDLFDYWFEYAYVIPRGYHHIISKLGMLVEKGITVRYIAGNHDFWLRDFFPNELGIPVYKDPFGIELRGKKFFFHHGDGLALNDTGYRILKKILRSRINIFLYSQLHPNWTAPLAHGSSHKSREYTGGKDFGETDGMLLFAKEKIITEKYDYVIMGHRHKPMEQKIENGVYFNLGDWISYNTYAEFDGTTVELKTWK